MSTPILRGFLFTGLILICISFLTLSICFEIHPDPVQYACSNHSFNLKTFAHLWPNLVLITPSLAIGLMIYLTFALFTSAFQKVGIHDWRSTLCIILVSIAYLAYVIAGEFLVETVFHWIASSSVQSEGIAALKLVVLPTLIGGLNGFRVGAQDFLQ